VGMQPNSNPYMQYMGQPHFPFPPYPMQYPGFPPQGFGFSRPSGRGMGGRGRRGRCLLCKDQGHYIADCPKIKKYLCLWVHSLQLGGF
jgi:hypothetical protein